MSRAPEPTPAQAALAAYRAAGTEDDGYLDFARFGPPTTTVLAEQAAVSELMASMRASAVDSLLGPQTRVNEAVAALIRFPADHIVFQPNASQGLMHTMFGLTGGLAMSASEFPAVTIAAARAAETLHVLEPRWLTTDDGRITPGGLREQLDGSVVAVALSLVDFRTGYLADLEGIRQVVGDRLLIVDASQAFPIVDAPWELADVVIGNGQKWARSGHGTGFLALSDRALEQLTPVFSGFNATDVLPMPLDEVPPPSAHAKKFQVTNPDPVAQARFAAGLEEVARVGVPAVNAAIGERVDAVIAIADEFGVPVASPRPHAERAGIVTLRPAPELLTALTASLHNHGVTVTARSGAVRLTPHVSTSDRTLDMLRDALVEFGSVTGV